MEKELVKQFDLEAAFKALDEIEIPVTKGIRANRANLKERFADKTYGDALVEDYYNVNSRESLEEAQEDREAEIAKAKLARIEKIVDLDAESEEDLQPSYVGKVIIQCPQCMTLFYKNPEDIEESEENPDVVNVNEVCQHCGNDSGYTVIGKVDKVGEDEAENYDLDAFEENELDLDFGEPTEEVSPEGTGGGFEDELNLDEIPVEEETAEDSSEDSEDDLDLDLDLDLEVEESLRTPLNEEAAGSEIPLVEELSDSDGSSDDSSDEALPLDENLVEAAAPVTEEITTTLFADIPVVIEDSSSDDSSEDSSDEIVENFTGTPEIRTTHLEYEDKDPADGKAVLPDNLGEELKEEAKIEEHVQDRPAAIEDETKYQGVDNAVVDCEKNLVISHSEDEKPVDCLMKKEPLEKPVAGEKVEIKINEEAKDCDCKDGICECGDKAADNTPLTEAPVDELIDKVMDSEEFKEPVSKGEVEAILADEKSKEGIEEEIKQVEECKKLSEEFEKVEDLNEEALNKHISAYLTEVYSNVKDFTTTGCTITKAGLVVEGIINFNSGNTKDTKFNFTSSSFDAETNKYKLEGFNKDFGADASFILECCLEDGAKCLLTESFGYKYTINNILVEGLK